MDSNVSFIFADTYFCYFGITGFKQHSERDYISFETKVRPWKQVDTYPLFPIQSIRNLLSQSAHQISKIFGKLDYYPLYLGLSKHNRSACQGQTLNIREGRK